MHHILRWACILSLANSSHSEVMKKVIRLSISDHRSFDLAIVLMNTYSTWMMWKVSLDTSFLLHVSYRACSDKETEATGYLQLFNLWNRRYSYSVKPNFIMDEKRITSIRSHCIYVAFFLLLQYIIYNSTFYLNNDNRTPVDFWSCTMSLKKNSNQRAGEPLQRGKFTFHIIVISSKITTLWFLKMLSVYWAKVSDFYDSTTDGLK